MELKRLSDYIMKEHVGEEIAVCGILTSYDLRPMKNDKQSCTLVLQDRDSKIDIKWFDITEEMVKELNIVLGDTYDIILSVKKYDRGKDGLSYIVSDSYIKKSNSITKDDCVDWEDFLSTRYSQLNELLSDVNCTIYGKIAHKIITDHWEDYKRVPAATSMHHSGFGGTLVHSVEVALLCNEISKFYNNVYGPEFVNRDLLISCALIHDIGKVVELSADISTGAVSYSNSSALLNHIGIGLNMITTASIEMGVNTRREVMDMQHLIASHHGRIEWGCLIEPNCIEADILSGADLISGNMNRRMKVNKGLDNGESTVQWTGSGKLTYYKALKSDRPPEM